MARVAPADQPVLRPHGSPGLGHRLRRMSEHLDPLKIENDHTKNPFFQNIFPKQVTVEETRKEGKMLLENFIIEEIDKDEDIETPEDLKERLNLCTPEGYANPEWAKAGQDLRRLADDFVKSKERRKVRRRALQLTDEQDVQNVTRDKFRDLLSEFLLTDITRDHIVILFFFCSDVTIALLKRRMAGCIELCQRFIQWSVEFIMEHVCTWVQSHGGWGQVFGSSMIFIGKIAAVLGIGVIGYLGYKKISKLLQD